MGQVSRPRLLSNWSIGFCGALVGIAAGAASAHAAPVTDPASGHTYEVIQEAKSWFGARDAAKAMSTDLVGCRLAAITSQAENDFVVANLINPLPPPDPNNTDDVPDVWIGGERADNCPATEDSSTLWGDWVTGEAWVYTNWRADEPDECDENCLLYGREGQPPKWENEFCDPNDADEPELTWYLVECAPLKVVDPQTKHSYQLIRKESTWEEARVSAAAMSTATEICHLATITSQAEENFILSELLPGVPEDSGDGEDIWLGGRQRDPCIGGTVNNPSLWGTWVTGEPWVYTNWSDHEPDGEDDSDGGCPLLGCLTYGSEEAPPQWEDAGCEDEEVTACLVECEPIRAVPAISPEAIVVISLLAVVLAWWGLRRREAEA